jgi:hypothetical protein
MIPQLLVVSHPIPQVRIGITGRAAKVSHTIRQVGMECCTSALQAIECADNNGRLACVGAKFWAQRTPYFLLDRGRNVGIQDVCHFYLEVIESGNG